MNIAPTILTSCILAFVVDASAVGERYAKEGHQLFAALVERLVTERHCSAMSDCLVRLDAYGEDGDMVRLNIYGVTDRNLVGSIVNFAVHEGVRVTNGVPIKIQFFEKRKRDSLNMPWSQQQPIIKLEISK